ncbi:MAG TPA: hypothetical protein PKA00_14540 [Saprospiraceae bacterium]|nr:hypothetical protein [Saprospiraceae bacterium]HMQ84128.1 hypothetical protein [Saprospiraceae bacterium]
MTLPSPFSTRMQSDLGETEWRLFCQTLESPPPISLHYHVLKNFNWQENIGKVKWYSNGVYLKERPVFTLDPAFHAGAYYVQEASSMFLAEALRQLAPQKEGLNVLDLCAAPGGKSTLILSLLGESCLLLSNEVIRSRYQILRQNLAKWAYPNAASSQHDSEDFLPLSGFFDVVLVDAPCSGEGLFRKDPEAVKEWSENHVQLCAARQRRILGNAVQLLAPGGLLLYATCTYNDLENEENSHWLSTSAGLQPRSISLESGWNIHSKQYGYQFYPHRLQGEGFYLAAFQKSTDSEKGIYKDKGKRLSGHSNLSKEELDRLDHWIRDSYLYHFYKNKSNDIIAIPSSKDEGVKRLASALPKSDWGITIGTFKGKDFIPDHHLALSRLVAEGVPTAAVDRNTALLFLKREPIPLEGQPEGWVLVTYEGLGLGWAKKLHNRVNNYLPKEWRIRMEIN